MWLKFALLPLGIHICTVYINMCAVTSFLKLVALIMKLPGETFFLSDKSLGWKKYLSAWTGQQQPYHHGSHEVTSDTALSENGCEHKRKLQGKKEEIFL